ncbi:MAG: iron ABC transporter permease, partial [Leptolyngbya sp. SIO1D8]|nr:iron ABC transporter permease [Leptolyngbya sp. SIO1D8]
MLAKAIQRSRTQPQMLRALGILLSLLLLLGCFAASIALGVADIGVGDILQALTQSDGSTEHLIIRTIRVPRSITA